jgi:hypothetical protein
MVHRELLAQAEVVAHRVQTARLVAEVQMVRQVVVVRLELLDMMEVNIKVLQQHHLH